LAKRGRALSWLDSVIAVLLTLLLTGSLFIPEYRFVQAAQKIRLADLVLDYNRFLRHHIEHLPGIGRIFGEFQITQFALFYIELFAGGLLALSISSPQRGVLKKSKPARRPPPTSIWSVSGSTSACSPAWRSPSAMD
jgi:hypothetical protein